MPPENSAPNTTTPDLPLSEHGRWKARNAEGLALAANGDWHGASALFDEALAYVDALTANDSVTIAARDNSRAKVLLNLAQSRFQTGAHEEARQFAERALAIRTELFSADSLVVARTRSDLALILSAMGEHDGARGQLQDAIATVERKPGEQAALLLPILAGTAETLASAQPSDAEFAAIRLRLADLMQREAERAELHASDATTPQHSFRDHAFASGADDQPLRAAIAETANLLRKTPPSNAAHNVNLDDAVFDLVEPPPPTLSALPSKSKQDAPANPLGFEVQYGIPTQLHEPIDTAITMEIPVGGQPVETADIETPKPATDTPVDSRAVVFERESFRSPNGIQRGPVRAVGGIRRGSTQVMTPKLLYYMVVALVAFGAGIAITLLVLALRG